MSKSKQRLAGKQELGIERRLTDNKRGRPNRPLRSSKDDAKGSEPTEESGGQRPSTAGAPPNRPIPRPTATPKPIPRPTATPNPPSQPTASPNPIPRPTATPNPTPQPTASPNPIPRPTATPKPIPRPTATPKPIPRPTATPKAASSQRPMPKPPEPQQAAAVGTAGIAAAAALSQEQQTQAKRIASEFERVEKEAQLARIYGAIGRFDARSVDFPFTLDGLRRRGYVHARQLEEQLKALDGKWTEVRPRVETTLGEQVQRLNGPLTDAARRVRLMNSAAAILGAETAVKSLANQISAAERAVSGLYQGLETELNAINSRLNNLERMLALYEGAPEIRLYEAEGPLLAVTAVWQQNGKEGPEGILFLTDQRFIFEQREEVVTKRRLGLFKAESEKIQKVLFEVQAHEIEQVAHKEEGGFLGMGKADILELVFAANAPLTRARFHLKGQDSSDWAAMIKRVQTGDIHGDRAEAYVEAIAAVMDITFPSQCPSCFAAVEPPPRGATSTSCGFCGAVIQPEVA